MNIWTRKLTNKQKRRKWAKARGIFSVVIPVEGGGGGWGVRVLRKVTRIMIEGFLRGFQISHCRIFGGKKIWKVPFAGGGGGEERCCEIYVRFQGVGRHGSKQSENWFCMAPLAYTTWVSTTQIVLPLFYLHANFPVISVTFIVSFL